MSAAVPQRYVALCGGVGGAKLADGLARSLPPDALTIAVNVGDDFEHLGLTICPDLDTVLYTLGGVAHPQQGWGRADESWQVFGELRRLGGDDWFQLGDRDIALHLLRRGLLDRGMTLSAAIAEIARRLDVAAIITPVSDDPVHTILNTDQGRLAFQDYFVRRRCEPRVLSLEYEGAQVARLAPALVSALDDPLLAGVILCPSNPYLSIEPMLAIADLRYRLRGLRVPVIAVSPIVGGKALKGPAAKMMHELGFEPGAARVIELYGDFLHALLIDTQDSELAQADARLRVADTVMMSTEHRVALARHCIDLLRDLAGRV